MCTHRADKNIIDVTGKLSDFKPLDFSRNLYRNKYLHTCLSTEPLTQESIYEPVFIGLDTMNLPQMWFHVYLVFIFIISSKI